MHGFMEAVHLVFQFDILAVLVLSSLFGLFMGSIPGLTATMAVALIVPLTFFMDPIAAMGAVVGATSMAIFAGDIPGALLRIPGTPASAAYSDDSFLLSQKGYLELSLGSSVIFSSIGGLFGSVFFIFAAPALAELALLFTSFEYFWLTLMGLSSAVIISKGSNIRGWVALIIGLLLATIGLDISMGFPRFTFGNSNLAAGIDILPALIGAFAISEILRSVSATDLKGQKVQQHIGNLLKGVGKVGMKYKFNVIRSGILGTLIGALPGSGATMASYLAYALSKSMSKEKEKYGTGHIEGIIDASSANNASVAGAWIPALVFGIPGDTLTAIALGVLFMKGINPGPTIFMNTPEFVYAIFILFIIANVLMIPFGLGAIKVSKHILSVPPSILYPLILMTTVVGTFSVQNATFDLILMLGIGILAYVMNENGFPLAPMILGLLLGEMLENNFMGSIVKAQGNLLVFFERPLSAVLGIITILLWVFPIVKGFVSFLRSAKHSKSQV
ncbi:MAG: tripartite tricarboxylate transporter permease [Sphaerochaeta sp.]|nr:tripartite tricarboxylate transporter permease [Sphaerochaeta sp.]